MAALHMVGGGGETSYANNSKLQEKSILKKMIIVEEAIAEVHGRLLPESMVVADLGCSSGPNTLLVISEIIGIIGRSCRSLGRHPPEVQFCLNDLPGNDFNTIFQSLACFDRRVREEKGEMRVPYYVAGIPGSFYGRIFPRGSVHFVHSSYALMWLSQVPQGLESDIGAPLHKKNIYITNTTPASVVKLYSEHYRRDFSAFLKSRSEEIISGGRMVLTFLGRKNSNPSSAGLCYLWGLLAEALNAMASEGLLEQTLVDDFYLPFYAPSMDEVKSVISSEGSFDLDRAQTLESNWDPFDDSSDDSVFDSLKSGEIVAKYIRAVIEPMIASRFGEAVTDDLFSRYSKNVTRHLLTEKTKYVELTISLKTKG